MSTTLARRLELTSPLVVCVVDDDTKDQCFQRVSEISIPLFDAVCGVVFRQCPEGELLKLAADPDFRRFSTERLVQLKAQVGSLAKVENTAARIEKAVETRNTVQVVGQRVGQEYSFSESSDHRSEEILGGASETL